MADVESTPSSSSSFLAQASTDDLMMEGFDESKLTIEGTAKTFFLTFVLIANFAQLIDHWACIMSY